jgi:hypothetical protein
MSFNTASRPRKFKGTKPLTAEQYEVRQMAEKLRELAFERTGRSQDFLRDAADKIEEMAGLK